jgi:hypothetical protein
MHKMIYKYVVLKNNDKFHTTTPLFTFTRYAPSLIFQSTQSYKTEVTHSQNVNTKLDIFDGKVKNIL